MQPYKPARHLYVKDCAMTRIFIICLFALFAVSCSLEKNNEDILQVRYGTSFGECIGYCKQNINVISGLVVYTKSGWIDTFETIICSESLNDQTWDSLTGGLETRTARHVNQLAELLRSRKYKNLTLETAVFENETHVTCYPAAISRALVELNNNVDFFQLTGIYIGLIPVSLKP